MRADGESLACKSQSRNQGATRTSMLLLPNLLSVILKKPGFACCVRRVNLDRSRDCMPDGFDDVKGIVCTQLQYLLMNR
jgi:hypothetical protein